MFKSRKCWKNLFIRKPFEVQGNQNNYFHHMIHTNYNILIPLPNKNLPLGSLALKSDWNQKLQSIFPQPQIACTTVDLLLLQLSNPLSLYVHATQNGIHCRNSTFDRVCKNGAPVPRLPEDNVNGFLWAKIGWQINSNGPKTRRTCPNFNGLFIVLEISLLSADVYAFLLLMIWWWTKKVFIWLLIDCEDKFRLANISSLLCTLYLTTCTHYM